MKVYVYENLKDMKNKENHFIIESVDDINKSMAGGFIVTSGETEYVFPNTVYAIMEE